MSVVRGRTPEMVLLVFRGVAGWTVDVGMIKLRPGVRIYTHQRSDPGGSRGHTRAWVHRSSKVREVRLRGSQKSEVGGCRGRMRAWKHDLL